MSIKKMVVAYDGSEGPCCIDEMTKKRRGVRDTIRVGGYSKGG